MTIKCAIILFIVSVLEALGFIYVLTSYGTDIGLIVGLTAVPVNIWFCYYMVSKEPDREHPSWYY